MVSASLERVGLVTVISHIWRILILTSLACLINTISIDCTILD